MRIGYRIENGLTHSIVSVITKKDCNLKIKFEFFAESVENSDVLVFKLELLLVIIFIECFILISYNG